jgi:hypothetical protein
MRFAKSLGYFISVILLSLLSVNVFAQGQKKTDGVYGPMNWGLDRQDGFDFEKLRFDNEVNRLLRERDAQIIAVGKEMKKCRTSQCRAPLHRKIDQIEINNRRALQAEAELHSKRIELLNKYWDEQDKKTQKRRIYFP